MIIDFHTHVLPPEEFGRFAGSDQHVRLGATSRGKVPQSIEHVLAAQEEGGVDATLISNPMNRLRGLDPDKQLDLVERHNRYMASQQEKHASIYAMAGTNPYGDERFLREFERAVTQDGLKGAWITSSLDGHYPDDEEALPFFQLAAALDVPVVIHPPLVGFGEERMREYRLASSIGRPMDNALAIARLIVRGIFEKVPGLKLVGTHLGGGICEMIGRMDYAYNLQGDEGAFLGSYAPMLIKHPPSHYLRRMYLESTCYHAPAARCALETVGAEHFLFGTDAPPLLPLKKQGVALIKELGLAPADERKVYGDNAKALLKI
jgi:aminocarboxymuconate-semialdehyde decarboxylase